MTRFEKFDPDSDDDFSEEFLIDEGLVDEGLVDEDLDREDLLEIQSQLEQDSQHLASLYPPMSENRLDDLVSLCLEKAQASEKTVTKQQADNQKKIANGNSFTRKTRWYQFGSALCITALLIGSFTYVWNQPRLDSGNEPVVSNHKDSGEYNLVPAVSVSELPSEFLNASQPELEALYDELPSESMSIEF